jgi:hypothetical protein
MTNLAVAVLVLESVAEQWTVVRPILKWLPEAGLQVAGTESSLLSWAVTV